MKSLLYFNLFEGNESGDNKGEEVEGSGGEGQQLQRQYRQRRRFEGGSYFNYRSRKPQQQGEEVRQIVHAPEDLLIGLIT